MHCSSDTCWEPQTWEAQCGKSQVQSHIIGQGMKCNLELIWKDFLKGVRSRGQGKGSVVESSVNATDETLGEKRFKRPGQTWLSWLERWGFQDFGWEFNLLAKKERRVPGTSLTFDNKKWWSTSKQFRRNPKVLFPLTSHMLPLIPSKCEETGNHLSFGRIHSIHSRKGLLPPSTHMPRVDYESLWGVHKTQS